MVSKEPFNNFEYYLYRIIALIAFLILIGKALWADVQR
jgi:hypothetical protein